MNILWIINCKYYRYIASYSSINMIYAANKGGQFYSGGGSIVPVYYCPRGAEVFRYIITSRTALYQYNIAPPPPPRQESGEAVLCRYTGLWVVWRFGVRLCWLSNKAHVVTTVSGHPPPPRTFPPPPRAIPPGHPPPLRSQHIIWATVCDSDFM